MLPHEQMEHARDCGIAIDGHDDASPRRRAVVLEPATFVDAESPPADGRERLVHEREQRERIVDADGIRPLLEGLL
jgi:hypothetical protein